MGVTIRFIGGPADGRTYAIPNETPPPLYLIPIAPPLAELFSTSIEPTLTKTAEYQPLHDGGWPRRADDGAFLYQHRVPPVTPEERARLERDRRDAADWERVRQAEIAEGWRQIREERPHYPEDWRGL
jgi:hypothetical protein